MLIHVTFKSEKQVKKKSSLKMLSSKKNPGSAPENLKISIHIHNELSCQYNLLPPTSFESLHK